MLWLHLFFNSPVGQLCRVPASCQKILLEGFSEVEKSEPVIIHTTSCMDNFSAMFVLLNSLWDHRNEPSTPCQGKARTSPSPLWNSAPLWHGFHPLQQAEAWAQLAQSLILAKDHPELAVWMWLCCIEMKEFSSMDVASTVVFEARMDPGSVYCANKDVSVCHTAGFGILWSTSALAWHTSVVCPVRWTKYFLVHSGSFCWAYFASSVTYTGLMSMRPSLHPSQMSGALTVAVLHICRQLIWRLEWFTPDQVSNGHTGVTRSLSIPSWCCATHTRSFLPKVHLVWTAEEELVFCNCQWKVQASRQFQE